MRNNRSLNNFLENLLINYFNVDEKYLKGLRSGFNDSYEVYGADYTPNLYEQFQSRRGYSPIPYMYLLFDTLQSELKTRFLCDYRATIGDLLLENFVQNWTNRSHSHGILTTEQAHGAPGNILDLYTASDIPQVESFGPSCFNIPGVRTDEDTKRVKYKRPDKLFMKFGSSAAHVTGKKLISAETGTWLTNHFRMALSQIKPQIDELFVAGINHIMLISSTNVPADVPFPGWVFYPAPDFGPYSSFRDYLPDLSAYVSRCQKILQESTPDNELLVYFPIYDYYSEVPADLGVLAMMDHVTTKWGYDQPFSLTVNELWREGYSFDYISDREIERLIVENKQIKTSGGTNYKAIVIPACKRIPVETMQKLLQLAEQGIPVFFDKKLPGDVPGLNDLNNRLNKLEALKKRMSSLVNVKITENIAGELQKSSLTSEVFPKMGLEYIRKKNNNGKVYFISNLDNKFKSGNIELKGLPEKVILFNPLTNQYHIPEAKQNENSISVRLELLPGESVILFAGNNLPDIKATPLIYYDENTDEPLQLNWKMTFESGDVNLKNASFSWSGKELTSWTEWNDSIYQYFTGTVIYKTSFDLPKNLPQEKIVRMKLDDVRDMAEVRVNGTVAGRLWCVPYMLDIDRKLLKNKNNKLEIRVRNIDTNRIILMDKQKTEWKTFYIADPKKSVFDASDWNIEPAGIIGEIKLSVASEQDSREQFTMEERPWLWWYWLGSEVTEDGISRQLEQYRKMGYGGASIAAVYSVNGRNQYAIPFMSPLWVDRIDFTTRKAKELGMGIDASLTSAWPFGGPNVTPDMAAQYSTGGPQNNDIISNPTRQQTKRSGPGGEGLVLDHFNRQSVEKYLLRYDSLFINGKCKYLRSGFNDSYEVYGADYTPVFLEEFQKRRGYDFRKELSNLFAANDSETHRRVLCDYRETISDLLIDNFMKTWAEWSKKHGIETVEQAHGSPANWLDLYAEADIPETESFGSSKLPIPLLRTDPVYNEKSFGRPDKLLMKFASSAAHVSGKKYVASETATWLGNHFNVALSQVKPQIDEVFVSGINHVMLTCAAYSPEELPFPGLKFYPATDFGYNSTFASYIPELSSYIARCQKILQNSVSDNEILLYFPVHDIWSEYDDEDKRSKLIMFTIHNPNMWFYKNDFGTIAKTIYQSGFDFDYISDRQIELIENKGNRMVTQGGKAYKTLVIPNCKRMPLKILQKLLFLAKKGVPIIFAYRMPTDVPGFYLVESRKEQLKKLIAELKSMPNVYITPNINSRLQLCMIKKEKMAEGGLNYIRKKTNAGIVYFIANQQNIFSEGWVSLGTDFKRAIIIDPLTGKRGIAKRKNQNELYLQLKPGQSCFVELDSYANQDWVYFEEKQSMVIDGEWRLSFEEGYPQKPASVRMRELHSWTELPDTAATYFSGTARYEILFDLPQFMQKKERYLLDLGDVREAAEVFLNDKYVGKCWSLPFEINIDPLLLKTNKNKLTIKVRNLDANRIRWMDINHVPWKNFFFVDVAYNSFDASQSEPVPSGLTGKIRLKSD